MGWDFDYSVSVGRGASGGTALSTIGELSRILPEVQAPKRDNAIEIPYRHGSVGAVQKWYSNFFIPFEVQLYDTESDGVTVSHTNGRAGHIYEHWHALKQLLGGEDSELWIGRDDPDAGLVEIPFEVIVGVTSTAPRRRQAIQLKTRWPFWSEEAQRTSLTDFTLAGTAPVADAVMVITSGTDVKVTHDQTGDFVQIDGATPAGGIKIDCGTKLATYVTGGASADPVVTRSAAYWFQFWPGSNTFTITGGGSIAISLYEQYL